MVKILFTMMEGKSDTTMVKQNIDKLTIEEQLEHMTKFFSQDLRYLDPSDCYRKELDLYEAITIFKRRQLSKSSVYLSLQDRFKSSQDFISEFHYLFEENESTHKNNSTYNKKINDLCRDVYDIFWFMKEGELREAKGKLNNYLFSAHEHPYYIKKGNKENKTQKDNNITPNEKKKESRAQIIKRAIEDTPKDEIKNDRIQEDLVKARKMANDYLSYDESLYVEDFLREYEMIREDFDLFRALLLIHDRPIYDEFLKKYRENREKRKKSIEKSMKAIKAISEKQFVFPNENAKNIYIMSKLPRCNEEEIIDFGLPPRANQRHNFATLYKYFFEGFSKEAIKLEIANTPTKGEYIMPRAKITKNEALKNLTYKIVIEEKEDNKEKGKKEKKVEYIELSENQQTRIIEYIEARNIVLSSRIFTLLANSMLRYGRTLDEKYFILRRDIDICKAIGKNRKGSVLVKAKKIAKHVPSKAELEAAKKASQESQAS